MEKNIKFDEIIEQAVLQKKYLQIDSIKTMRI